MGKSFIELVLYLGALRSLLHKLVVDFHSCNDYGLQYSTGKNLFVCEREYRRTKQLYSQLRPKSLYMFPESMPVHPLRLSELTRRTFLYLHFVSRATQTCTLQPAILVLVSQWLLLVRVRVRVRTQTRGYEFTNYL